MKYTLDAKNKKLGRIASEAATILMGKNTTSFVKNAVPNVEVTIVNASKADITEKKREQKLYTRYSGYPGGIVKETMDSVIEKHGFAELFRKAVYRMIPHNKLTKTMMKHLTVTE
ncbi:MAG: 50S ribosomal protein L13 [Patescibacteria group bacterium]